MSTKENLEWRLMSKQKIAKGDCLRFVFSNPYIDDAPETYRSFDMSTRYSQPCSVSLFAPQTHPFYC